MDGATSEAGGDGDVCIAESAGDYFEGPMVDKQFASSESPRENGIRCLSGVHSNSISSPSRVPSWLEPVDTDVYSKRTESRHF